jgi:ethanolamine utilization protein EutN
MFLGKVIGEVVATRKHETHEGLKLLSVAILELDGSQRKGAPLVAVDNGYAGVGDRVLVTIDGWGAMTSVGRRMAPIDAAVLGVVDAVEPGDQQ